MDATNYFETLASIDVSEHVEKKGKFSYLSWAWAVDVLRKHDPKATWEVIRFDGKPFMKTECGYFVEVAVTCQGITLSQIHPVLNNFNKPIPQPNAFEINTSIQRCLVKAIALHGLGLYIYAGEDLPTEEKNNYQSSKENVKVKYLTLGYSEDKFENWYTDKRKKLSDLQIEANLTKMLKEKSAS